MATVEATPGAEQHALLGVAAWLWRVAVWVVLLGSAALLLIAVLIPRVSGATPYTILTGSMRPTMPPGTLVVVKPAEIDQIKVGDVVTYQMESGRPTVVTHRVVALVSSLSGERSLRTQGDDNPVADSELVRPVQVRGTVWYSVPFLGRLSLLFTGGERQLGVYAAAGGLALYAAWMFGGSLRERVRPRRPSGRSVP